MKTTPTLRVGHRRKPRAGREEGSPEVSPTLPPRGGFVDAPRSGAPHWDHSALFPPGKRACFERVAQFPSRSRHPLWRQDGSHARRMSESITSHFGEALRGLIYPRNCAGCQTPISEAGDVLLCAGCLRSLEPIAPPLCEVCGEPFDSASSAPFRCSNCTGRKLHFDFAVAGYRARGRVRELIHRFKYRREYHLCRVLAQMLADAFADERIGRGDWHLVPVPLHPRRKREREYNQAEELCRQVSRIVRMPVLHALRRTRYTAHQAKLDRSERLKNLEDAFALRRSGKIREAIRGARIMVVDDVLTTGATMSECARVLREEGGAAQVIAVTVARG